MHRQIMELLQNQEAQELAAYQSPASICRMMQEELENSAAIFQALKASRVDIVRLFHSAAELPCLSGMPVPIRKSEFFRAAKHTTCQVSYWHRHDFYELVYVLRGSCTQKIEAACHSHDLKEHQACLLKPGISHILGRCTKDDIILKFSIPKSLYEESIAPILAHDSEEDILIFDNYNAQIALCLFMLLKESHTQRDFCAIAIKNYLSLLFIELVRQPLPCDSQLMQKIETYLRQSLANASLHDFAVHIGYSDDYAGRLIKRETGKSFTQLVLEQKLSKAGKYLLETDLSVTCIANSLGYISPSGFYKQFSRAYAMTPEEYRRTFSNP